MEKLITAKYKMHAPVNKADFLHDQRKRAKDYIDSYARRMEMGDFKSTAESLIFRIDDRNMRYDLKNMLHDDNAEALCNELLKKFKSTCSAALRGYEYTPQRSIYTLKYEALPNVEGQDGRVYEDAIILGLNQYIEKHISEDYAVAIANSLTLEYDGWRISDMSDYELIESKYISAEEAGKEKYSPVCGGVFTSYYYYKVKVRILGEEFEGIITLDRINSGGWN